MKITKFYGYRQGRVVSQKENAMFDRGTVSMEGRAITAMWEKVIKDNGYRMDNHITFIVECEGFWQKTSSMIVRMSDWRVTFYDTEVYEVIEG